MTEAERSRVADGEEASSRLNAGLKTCRAMVANYRAMLSEEPGTSGATAFANLATAESDATLR